MESMKSNPQKPDSQKPNPQRAKSQKPSSQETDLYARIGKLLKNLPNQHEVELTVGMSLHSSSFFQKMVCESLLEKGGRIKPEDYYKGMIFLNYFTDYLADDFGVCDNLIQLSKYAKKELNDSELSLDVVVIETGLFAKEKKQDYFTSRTNMAAMKRRYINKDFMVDMNSKTNRQAEPYYTALGRMVADTVSRERQKYLENINMRSQLQALVFTDSVVGYLKDDACRKQVEQSLAKGEYFDASLQAIDGFRKEVSLEELGKHFVKKC